VDAVIDVIEFAIAASVVAVICVIGAWLGDR
jgi:hypothetical protein